ncbi:hypothetical protein B7P43_G08965 [Cryptotermes secundus]|uniref:Neurotransmitter-gated ion-channel ligand-binding domain-containing protein n=1 Tax=Cryptotermes secundus TaxID=105785 RepID=A0A2J7PSB5_9NEOP|nr:hypothetical protein B7P43_G08965 [Cryptotermes secundus]
MGSVLLALLLSVIGGTVANPEAKRLYDDLLSNYNRLIRPVGNNSDRLTVKMGLRLSQLIDVMCMKIEVDCTIESSNGLEIYVNYGGLTGRIIFHLRVHVTSQQHSRFEVSKSSSDLSSGSETLCGTES